MFAPPLVRLLPDGRRLHLQQGPIDLVIGADGPAAAIAAAYDAARSCFEGLLGDLCDELPLLRAPVGPASPEPLGAVARAMRAAVHPFAIDSFITPMAAVAGAVADHVLAAMVAAAGLDRAFVNNGGDIALHLAPGRRFTVGLIDRPDRPGLFGTTAIGHADPIRGLATSGRGGRSFSLGIADAVTVLARTAAMADAAATVIGNAVDLPGHPAVTRVPAVSLQPDSDLGRRPVTRAVAPLTSAEIDTALAMGCALAERFCDRGLIAGAALHLQGRTRLAGAPPTRPTALRSLAHA